MRDLVGTGGLGNSELEVHPLTNVQANFLPLLKPVLGTYHISALFLQLSH